MPGAHRPDEPADATTGTIGAAPAMTRRVGLASLAILGLALLAAPRTTADTLLWNDIRSGMAADVLDERSFEDARHTSRRMSSHGVIDPYFMQTDNPVVVTILFQGKPRTICDVDIEGAAASRERHVLTASYGLPLSRSIEERLMSPGGAAALLSGGKIYRVSRWRHGGTIVTFEERIRPGYFRTRYREASADGKPRWC